MWASHWNDLTECQRGSAWPEHGKDEMLTRCGADGTSQLSSSVVRSVRMIDARFCLLSPQQGSGVHIEMQLRVQTVGIGGRETDGREFRRRTKSKVGLVFAASILSLPDGLLGGLRMRYQLTLAICALQCLSAVLADTYILNIHLPLIPSTTLFLPYASST